MEFNKAYTSIFAFFVIVFIGNSCKKDNTASFGPLYNGPIINTWLVDSLLIDTWSNNGYTLLSSTLAFTTDSNGNVIDLVVSLSNSGVYINSQNIPEDTLYVGSFTISNSMITYSDRPGRQYDIIEVNDSIFTQESEQFNNSGTVYSERWYHSAY